MTRWSASLRFAALIAAAALVAGCGGGQPEPADTGSATPSATSSAPSDTPAPSPSPTAAPTTPAPTTPVPAVLPQGFAGRIVTTLPTTQKVVALTFDGGASDAGVASILSTLSAQGVRATFFVTGDFAQRYPARVAAMAAAGHVVGNHSATHPDFTTLSAAGQIAQLSSADAVIRPLIGSATAPWFRFPFGASNAAAITTVNSSGYAGIGWTVDTLGWKGTSGGQSADSVLDRVVSTAVGGQIVLLHVGANPDDGSTLDADALPAIIARLRALGYGFVALPDVV